MQVLQESNYYPGLGVGPEEVVPLLMLLDFTDGKDNDDQEESSDDLFRTVPDDRCSLDQFFDTNTVSLWGNAVDVDCVN